MPEEKYEIFISINMDCQCKMINKWHDCNHACMHTLSVIYRLIRKKIIEPVPFEWQIFVSQWKISSSGNHHSGNHHIPDYMNSW